MKKTDLEILRYFSGYLKVLFFVKILFWDTCDALGYIACAPKATPCERAKSSTKEVLFRCYSRKSNETSVIHSNYFIHPRFK